MAYTSPVNMIL